MNILEYAILRGAYQEASPPQQDELVKLARLAETGDRMAMLNLRIFAMELLQQTEIQKAAAAGRGK
jgi:hypothetical protein